MLLDVSIFLALASRFDVFESHFAGSVVSLSNFSKLNYFRLAFAVFENLALAVLVTVSTHDHRPTHEAAFIVWLVSFHAHCALYVVTYLAASGAPTSCSVRRWRLLQPITTPLQRHIVRRLTIWGLNAVATVCCGAFFIQHKRTCVGGLYSMASLLEWVVVALNIAFHGCALLEFGEHRVSLWARVSDLPE